MTSRYKIIEDLKFREWEWIQLRVAPLNDHEINMISQLYNDDAAVTANPYKRRKVELPPDTTKVSSATMTTATQLDKEIQTTELQIENNEID